MALFFFTGCWIHDGWSIFPIAIHVQILVVETGWWVVPFSDFDGSVFV